VIHSEGEGAAQRQTVLPSLKKAIEKRQFGPFGLSLLCRRWDFAHIFDTDFGLLRFMQTFDPLGDWCWCGTLILGFAEIDIWHSQQQAPDEYVREPSRFPAGCNLVQGVQHLPIVDYVWLQVNHQRRACIALDAGRKLVAKSLPNILGVHAAFEQKSDALLSSTFGRLFQIVEQRGLVCNRTIEC
jgi:hypothetical protein